jgi:hypothetical protein
MSWANGFAVAGTFEGEFANTVESYAGKRGAKVLLVSGIVSEAASEEGVLSKHPRTRLSITPRPGWPEAIGSWER